MAHRGVGYGIALHIPGRVLEIIIPLTGEEVVSGRIRVKTHSIAALLNL